MTENEEIMVQHINADVIYQQDKASVDIQVATAKQYPRNVSRAVQNALAIACIDQKTAATCNYSVPRGGKAITGPTVHLAKILAQQWGNMRIEAKVVAVDATTVTSQGVCWDLENNIAVKVEVKRSIATRSGRMSDDMITVTGNAANSIALRNAVFSVIPKGIVDKVYSEACKIITGDVSDEIKLIARTKQVFDKMIGAYQVTEQEILSSVGKASVTQITPEDLVVIIGIGQAIKDGDTTVENAFRKPKTKKEAVDKKKEEMKAAKSEVKEEVKAEEESQNPAPEAAKAEQPTKPQSNLFDAKNSMP